jgi:hypothetical protein
MGTLSFLGVKRQGVGVDHPSPCSAEVKERVELCFYSPLVLHGLLKGERLVIAYVVQESYDFALQNLFYMRLFALKTTQNLGKR